MGCAISSLILHHSLVLEYCGVFLSYPSYCSSWFGAVDELAHSAPCSFTQRQCDVVQRILLNGHLVCGAEKFRLLRQLSEGVLPSLMSSKERNSTFFVVVFGVPWLILAGLGAVWGVVRIRMTPILFGHVAYAMVLCAELQRGVGL